MSGVRCGGVAFKGNSNLVNDCGGVMLDGDSRSAEEDTLLFMRSRERLA